MNKVKLVA